MHRRRRSLMQIRLITVTIAFFVLLIIAIITAISH